MNVSAAIANPLLRRTFGRRLAPRTLIVLHEYDSGPPGSARRSRDAAQRFRDELLCLMRARGSEAASRAVAAGSLPVYQCPSSPWGRPQARRRMRERR